MIKKQYHENINSNIYAHFLNVPNEEISGLLLNSLLDLILTKSGKELKMTSFFAQTEVTTNAGRLDICQVSQRCC